MASSHDSTASLLRTASLTPSAPQSYFEGNSCELRFASSRGRHLVATSSVVENEVILVSTAALCGILPSWKKRVCRNCFTTHSARLTVACRHCNQVWYCCEACRAMHWKGGASLDGSLEWKLLEHSKVCPVMRLFSGCRADAEIQSVLFMCLDAFATHQASGVSFAEGYSFDDLTLLQDHEEDIDPKDRREWLKAVNFLVSAFRRSGWEGEIPTSEEIMALVGRICSNNFGMWLTQFGRMACGRQAAPACLSPKESIKEDSIFSEAGQRESLELERGEKQTTNSLLPHLGDNSSSSSSTSQASLDSLALENGDERSEGQAVNPDGKLPKEVLIGRELFITASYINHSCNPNCLMRRPFSGKSGQRADGSPEIGKAFITALRDIQAGEELTISYIDLNLPVSARRHALKTGFFFDCQCERCLAELRSGSGKITHARSKQGGPERDYKPKRKGRKARTSR